MHVLILSCNTGQGHNSAAHAIKEALQRRGDSCEFHNALLFLSQVHDKIICDGHTFVYRRMPKLFGVGYRYEERHSPKFICSQMRLGVGKFQAFIEKRNFDAVICTHSFASILVNEYKKQTGHNILNAFVATDYTCCPGAPESECDIYFTPHPLLNSEFVSCGISSTKVVPLGIPVSEQFLIPTEKAAARKELGLPNNKKIVLVGCGSMGCGPIVKMSALLSRRLPGELIVVACGNNSRLLERLTRLEHGNILPLPYTKKMALYLSAADVFISKAGGLSTTEAICKQTPLLYIDAVPGCETRNIDFMIENGYASSADSPKDAVNKVIGILNNPKHALSGIKECRSHLAPNPADAICSYIENHIKS